MTGEATFTLTFNEMKVLAIACNYVRYESTKDVELDAETDADMRVIAGIESRLIDSMAILIRNQSKTNN